MKRFVFVLLLLSSNFFYSQDISITTSLGLAGYGKPLDGYYFSFNLGLPIVKGIEIAPTFTFMTDMGFDHKEVHYYWNAIDSQQFIVNNNKVNGDDMAGLMEVYLVIKPLRFFKNEKLSSIDFGMGTGYGISIYSDNYYNYNGLNAENDLVGVRVKNGIRQSMSAKLFYNYHIKKYFFGIAIGVHDFLKGEGVSTIGFQFGINP